MGFRAVSGLEPADFAEIGALWESRVLGLGFRVLGLRLGAWGQAFIGIGF